MTNGFKRLDGTTNLIFNKNKITIHPSKQQPTPNVANFHCQSNVAFLDNTNGVSRVMNLKPKKAITIQHNPSTRPLPPPIVNNFNPKPNGITLINTKPSTGIPRNKINAPARLIKAKNPNQIINGNSLLNKNQMLHFNNLMQPTAGGGFVFKFTGNGLHNGLPSKLLFWTLNFFPLLPLCSFLF